MSVKTQASDETRSSDNQPQNKNSSVFKKLVVIGSADFHQNVVKQ